MMDWTEARKSGVGVPITSDAMWAEYRVWLHEQVCEKCGAKYADKPPQEWWITETLCGRCWP